METKIDNFYNWLEEVKDLRSTTVHYHSVSLKSLLAGLPMGVEVGLLFGVILETQVKSKRET